jgi:CDP-diglyceride synthetase
VIVLAPALAALAALALFAGPIGAFVAALVVVALASGEVLRLARAGDVRPSSVVALVGALLLLVVAYLRDERAPRVFPAVIAAALGLAFVEALVRRQRYEVVRGIGSAMVPVFVVGLFAAYVVSMRGMTDGFRLVLAVFAFVMATQTGIVAAGRRSRQDRPLRTWQRYLAAQVGAFVAAVVIAITLPETFTWPTAIVLGVLIAAAAPTGALAMRMLVDDLSRAGPGIKRAPARVVLALDGVLAAAPVAFYAFRVLAR